MGRILTLFPIGLIKKDGKGVKRTLKKNDSET
jgi:hypothetical protein